jgi:hypothetical protein
MIPCPTPPPHNCFEHHCRYQRCPRLQRQDTGICGIRRKRKCGSNSNHDRLVVLPIASPQPCSRSIPQPRTLHPKPLTFFSRKRVSKGAVCNDVFARAARPVSRSRAQLPPALAVSSPSLSRLIVVIYGGDNSNNHRAHRTPSTCALLHALALVANPLLISQRSAPRLLPLPAAAVVGGVVEAQDVHRLFISDSAANIMSASHALSRQARCIHHLCSNLFTFSSSSSSAAASFSYRYTLPLALNSSTAAVRHACARASTISYL